LNFDDTSRAEPPIPFAVVTTCHSTGWQEYGRRMVQTFDRFWPADVPLYLYAEDFEPDHARPVVRRLPTWLSDFKKRHVNNPRAHGKIDGNYDYRYDCVRFAHKVAALTDAASTLNAEVLIWADGDIVSHDTVDHAWLNSLFPLGPYIAWLDRFQHYPECGFYMLRCNHRAHVEIMSRLQRLYETDAVFDVAETHDSYVLQQLILEAERERLLTTWSLSTDAHRHKHPLINGPLGARLDHLKGPRKAIHRSPVSDLMRPRSEAYWSKTDSPNDAADAPPQPLIEPKSDAGKTMQQAPKNSVDTVEGRASRYSQLQTLVALAKPRTIIEVGTNRGESAIRLSLEALKHQPKVHYIGFDVFDTKDEDFHRRAFNGKGSYSRQLVHDRLESIRLQHPSFTFELIEGDTSSTLHHRSMRADFVFIDGDHRAEVIALDYAALAKSRIIVFDDFYDPNSTQGRELINEIGCNRVVADLKDITILPLADDFPKTGPIRLAVKIRRNPFLRGIIQHSLP
jgi:predicted O-methyltransferase YrrM